MLKYLLSLFSIFVLLTPTILVPARAEACPVKLPETLLSLYRNSDAIYVATFDKVEDHETIENSDERSIVKIVKHFDVSSALKGETVKLFTIEENDYRYKSRESAGESDANESEEPEEEAPFTNRDLRSGDLVLVFAKKGEDGKTLELTDYRDAIKKMTRPRLESYEARIRELNSIFSGEEVDDAAIVNWLVDCIRDPHTRWEGAYQLQRSFEQLRWAEEQEKEDPDETSASNDGETETDAADTSEPADASSNDEETVAGEGEAGSGEGPVIVQSAGYEPDDVRYARLLTDAQKEVLMKMVVDRPSKSDDGNEIALSRGDKVLLDVVANWGDNRLAKYLLDRLQTSEVDGYVMSEMMDTIAKILDDKDLVKIAEKYSDVYYQDDDEAVEAEYLKDSSGDGDEEVEETPQVETKTADPANVVNPKAEAEVARVTYKEFRAQLLGSFVEKAFRAITIAEATKEEKASQ